MREEYADLVYLYVCSVRGIKPDFDKKYDINSIYNLSLSQNILQTMYSAFSEYSERVEKIEYIEKIKHISFSTYVFQYRRRAFLLKLLKEFEECNISFCLLKGETLAQYYKEPLLRTSGDIDIIVNTEDLDKAKFVLLKNDYRIETLKKGDHHFECHHSIYGLLEVHIKYCLDKTDMVCFKGYMNNFKKYIKECIPDFGTTYVLDYTEGYIYLLMHFIKHFISSGSGIRHLMDLALYYENNYNRIDHKKVIDVLSELGYERFYNSIMYICYKYLLCQVCKNDIIYHEDIEKKVERIFEDIFIGGIFGHADENRDGFYDYYIFYKSKRANYISKLNRIESLMLFTLKKKTWNRLPYQIFKSIFSHHRWNLHRNKSAYKNRIKMLKEIEIY